MSEDISPVPNAERPHHRFSPSKLQNLEACACYDGRTGGNLRAIAGSLAHGVTETGEDDHRLSDDDAAAAAECMDFYNREAQLMHEERARAVNKLAVELWGKTIDRPLSGEVPGLGVDVEKEADARTPRVVELTETYLRVDDTVHQCEGAFFKHTTAGYVDRAIINFERTRAKLFDWKFGLWPVEDAQNNLQGIAYVLGLARDYPTLQEIEFFFKQPHLGLISSAVFHRHQFNELYRRIQAVVERAIEAHDAKARGDWSAANPMVPVCNFCAHIGKCPKVAAVAFSIAKKFYPLGVPENVTPTFCDSPENTEAALNVASVMSVWASAYRAQVTDRVIRRDAPMPPGFTLATRADREVKDQKKMREITLQYLTEDELNRISSFPFGEAEEIVSDKAPRGLKTSTIKKYQEELLASGAVAKKQPYSFLRATAKRSEKETNSTGE